MRIVIGTKHNAICLLQDFMPGDGDPMQIAANKRPNTFRAIDEFEREMSQEIRGPQDISELTVTIFVDHCGGIFEDKHQRLAKTARGYSAGIVVTKNALMDGRNERATEAIRSVLDGKLAEILQRPALAVA